MIDTIGPFDKRVETCLAPIVGSGKLSRHVPHQPTDLTPILRVQQLQGVWSVGFSADDRTLASSCVSRVMIWQVGFWLELLSINEPITRIEFSPNGQYLVGRERSDQYSHPDTFPPRRLESPRIWPAPTLAE